MSQGIREPGTKDEDQLPQNEIRKYNVSVSRTAPKRTEVDWTTV